MPKCGAPVKVEFGIEVGHIFKLGTKYSEALDCIYLDETGKERPMIMGCYGIGINRSMAAVIEQNNDENGIIWPISIAPYHVIVIPVNTTDSVQMELAKRYIPSWEKWALRYCWMTGTNGRESSSRMPTLLVFR